MQISRSVNFKPLKISVKCALVFPWAGVFCKWDLCLYYIDHLKKRFCCFKKEQSLQTTILDNSTSKYRFMPL